MQRHSGQVLDLLDGQRRVLGRLTLEGREEDLLVGRFAPGPDFPLVERLFQDFEEAANAQALGAVDKLDAVIAALGLLLATPEGAEAAVKDVQIWSDGGMTCRLANPAAADGLEAHRQFTLDQLLSGVTDDNRHPEMPTGSPVGKEIW